jgi:penicillin amidase
VTYGPSTRRLVDFADPTHALGINPVGQSGVLFDKHYADQAQRYIRGEYAPERFSEGDVEGNSKEVLELMP